MIISGTYNLKKQTLFSQYSVYPNVETEFLCNTNLGAVVFNLLPISELTGFLGFTIIVSDYTANSSVNSITINATGGNTINGVTGSSIVINTNGESLSIQAISPNQWIAFATNGGGVPVSGDKNFVFTQVAPLTSWTVLHNLNKRCAVQVVDNAYHEVEAEVVWDNNNQVTVNFNSPTTGFVYCN
jgi:hypothetical protein